MRMTETSILLYIPGDKIHLELECVMVFVLQQSTEIEQWISFKLSFISPSFKISCLTFGCLRLGEVNSVTQT